ncbi:MAG: hypothetical protein WAV66_09535, partial [Anaerolineae bacterium]
FYFLFSIFYFLFSIFYFLFSIYYFLSPLLPTFCSRPARAAPVIVGSSAGGIQRYSIGRARSRLRTCRRLVETPSSTTDATPVAAAFRSCTDT